MTDPHEPLKFKINNPLSRIRHRKSTTRGRMCSQNPRISGGNNLYLLKIIFGEMFHLKKLKMVDSDFTWDKLSLNYFMLTYRDLNCIVINAWIKYFFQAGT